MKRHYRSLPASPGWETLGPVRRPGTRTSADGLLIDLRVIHIQVHDRRRGYWRSWPTIISLSSSVNCVSISFSMYHRDDCTRQFHVSSMAETSRRTSLRRGYRMPGVPPTRGGPGWTCTESHRRKLTEQGSGARAATGCSSTHRAGHLMRRCKPVKVDSHAAIGDLSGAARHRGYRRCRRLYAVGAAAQVRRVPGLQIPHVPDAE